MPLRKADVEILFWCKAARHRSAALLVAYVLFCYHKSRKALSEHHVNELLLRVKTQVDHVEFTGLEAGNSATEGKAKLFLSAPLLREFASFLCS